MNQKGSLLIILLWILAILSIVGITLGYRVALDIHLTKLSGANIRATYLARAALAKAITVIKKDKSLGYDTLLDVWANNPGEFKESKVGEYSFDIFYISNKQPVYGLIDAERKINLNTAPREVLDNLFENLELDTDLVPYLLDWIDEDDDDRNNGRGAENDYYENLKSPYSCRNAPLETFEDLLLVKGFNPDIIQKLTPYCTVFGSGQINLNTANPATFAAFGLPKSFTEKVARFRLGEDGIFSTDDDGIVSSFQEFLVAIENYESLDSEEKTLLNKYKNFFRVTSTAFEVQARVESSLWVKKDLFAVLQIEKGKDIEVIYTHEN